MKRSILTIAFGLLAPAAAFAATLDTNGSLYDVQAKVNQAVDGDTVSIPAGSFTWAGTLTVNKDISIIGAGDPQTTITEQVPRSGSPPLIGVDLSHELAAPKYSFRLSGMKIQPGGGVALAGDHAFLMLTGKSSIADEPLVWGCVSRVRIDHITFSKLNGLHMLSDSVLGVVDHFVFDSNSSGYPIKTKQNNWTPSSVKTNNAGTALVPTQLAKKAFGSWADDPYWGTEKALYFEDGKFITPSTTSFNIMDNEEGARLVVRHCNFEGGNGGLASHGMEGRDNPGIKQLEMYNNFLDIKRKLAQHRGGSVLYFNNLSTFCDAGIDLQIYRYTRTEPNWGASSGDNRYDQNAASPSATPIYSGTVTATTGKGDITDGNKANFNLLDMSDGSAYAIYDKNKPATGINLSTTANLGWRWKQGVITAVTGTKLSILNESNNTASIEAIMTPVWSVGDQYEIRRVLSAYGQPGQGKGNLLNPDATKSSSYYTYTYPATSGTLATYPMEGYPLEPCYSWNNTDLHAGAGGVPALLNFVTGGMKSLKSGRDFVNKVDITPHATLTPANQVGFPAQTYSGATSSYPGIGPNGTTPYSPYTYPHPLTQVNSPPSFAPTGSATFVVGVARSYTLNAGGFPAPVYTVGAGFPTWANLNTNTGVISGTPTSTTGSPYNFTITATNSQGADSQAFTLLVSATPSPTPTPTATPSASPSPTPTPSPTATPALRRYLFSFCDDGFLRVYDVDNGHAKVGFVQVTTLTGIDTRGMAVSKVNGRAYCFYNTKLPGDPLLDGRVACVDITNPKAPSLVYNRSGNGAGVDRGDITLDGSKLFMPTFESNTTQAYEKILDPATGQDFNPVQRVTMPTQTHNTFTSLDGVHVWMENKNGGVQAIDPNPYDISAGKLDGKLRSYNLSTGAIDYTSPRGLAQGPYAGSQEAGTIQPFTVTSDGAYLFACVKGTYGYQWINTSTGTIQAFNFTTKTYNGDTTYVDVHGLALNPAETELWVVDAGSNTNPNCLHVIDLTSINSPVEKTNGNGGPKVTLASGTKAHWITFGLNGQYAYAAGGKRTGQRASVVNTSTYAVAATLEPTGAMAEVDYTSTGISVVGNQSGLGRKGIVYSTPTPTPPPTPTPSGSPTPTPSGTPTPTPKPSPSSTIAPALAPPSIIYIRP